MNEYIIPFEPSTLIPAKTKTVVYAEIRGFRGNFKPECVVITAMTAQSFDVHEIRVRGQSLFSAPGKKIMGFLSPEQSTWFKVFRDLVLTIGERVEMTVENKTDVAVQLVATLTGKNIIESSDAVSWPQKAPEIR